MLSVLLVFYKFNFLNLADITYQVGILLFTYFH